MRDAQEEAGSENTFRIEASESLGTLPPCRLASRLSILRMSSEVRWKVFSVIVKRPVGDRYIGLLLNLKCGSILWRIRLDAFTNRCEDDGI